MRTENDVLSIEEDGCGESDDLDPIKRYKPKFKQLALSSTYQVNSLKHQSSMTPNFQNVEIVTPVVSKIEPVKRKKMFKKRKNDKSQTEDVKIGKPGTVS